MKTYCVKCKKTENLDSKIFKTKNSPWLCSQNVLSVELKSQDLWKKQKAKGLLSNLGIKTPLSQIPLLNVLF